MFKYKFIKYGVNAYTLILGTIHNNLKCKEFISKIFNHGENKFDFFLLELTYETFRFIKINKFIFSEFSEFTRNEVPKEKLIFIDISLQREIKEYQKLIRGKERSKSQNFFDDLIAFKLEKFLYYKIKNINNQIKAEEYSSIKNFYKIHIKLREDFMKQKIMNYMNKNNLIIIGINHFDNIHKFITSQHLN